jgi:hypothetical protein
VTDVEEPRTVADFVEALIAERGGRDRFSAVQVRLCHTIALALRDPQKVDPSTVSRLIDLLPPRVVPVERRMIPAIEFVDHFDIKLKRLLKEHAPDLLHDEMVAALADRIKDLESDGRHDLTQRERDALDLAWTLDELETAGGEVSADTLNALRGSLSGMLFPMMTAARFLAPYEVTAPSPIPDEKKRATDLPNANTAHARILPRGLRSALLRKASVLRNRLLSENHLFALGLGQHDLGHNGEFSAKSPLCRASGA